MGIQVLNLRRDRLGHPQAGVGVPSGFRPWSHICRGTGSLVTWRRAQMVLLSAP